MPGARESKRRPGGELEVRLHLLQGGRLLGQGWEVRPRGKVYRRQGVRGEKGCSHVGYVSGTLAKCEGGEGGGDGRC